MFTRLCFVHQNPRHTPCSVRHPGNGNIAVPRLVRAMEAPVHTQTGCGEFFRKLFFGASPNFSATFGLGITVLRAVAERRYMTASIARRAYAVQQRSVRHQANTCTQCYILVGKGATRILNVILTSLAALTTMYTLGKALL